MPHYPQRRLIWMQRTSSRRGHDSGSASSLFDLSITKILILGLLGLVIFGPDQLPRLAAQAGRALRDLRRLADNARADLSEHLGPEFRDFDLNDLNPKSFVRKHLLDPVAEDGDSWSASAAEVPYGELAEPEPAYAALIANGAPPY